MHPKCLKHLFHSPLPINKIGLSLPQLYVDHGRYLLDPLCENLVANSLDTIVTEHTIQIFLLLTFIIFLHPGSKIRRNKPISVHFNGNYFLLLLQLQADMQSIPLIENSNSQLVLSHALYVGL